MKLSIIKHSFIIQFNFSASGRPISSCRKSKYFNFCYKMSQFLDFLAQFPSRCNINFLCFFSPSFDICFSDVLYARLQKIVLNPKWLFKIQTNESFLTKTMLIGIFSRLQSRSAISWDKSKYDYKNSLINIKISRSQIALCLSTLWTLECMLILSDRNLIYVHVNAWLFCNRNFFGKYKYFSSLLFPYKLKQKQM